MVVRRISSPVFVGRRLELAALDEVLARAANGDGSAVLVEGEAGIGKAG
jgi:predicted ATPase